MYYKQKKISLFNHLSNMYIKRKRENTNTITEASIEKETK
jgi:hypothetical protein